MANLREALLEGGIGFWGLGGLALVVGLFGLALLRRASAREQTVSKPQMAAAKAAETAQTDETDGKATVKTAEPEQVVASHEGIRIVTPAIKPPEADQQPAIPDLAQLALQQAMKSANI